MFSANQISGFCNQPYLQKKQINEIAWFFCMVIQIHIDLKLTKIFWSGYGQNWLWPVWSWDIKIGCVSRMNWWDELIFCMLVEIQARQKSFQWFLGGHGKKWHAHLVHETLKCAEYVYELSWFFACWLWCNNFCLDQHHTLYLWLLNVSLLHLYLLDHWQ